MNSAYIIALSLCTVFTAYGMDTTEGEIESQINFLVYSSDGLYRAFGYENGRVKVWEDESQTQKVYITTKQIKDLFFNSDDELVAIYPCVGGHREVVMQVGKEQPSGWRCIKLDAPTTYGGAGEAN